MSSLMQRQTAAMTPSLTFLKSPPIDVDVVSDKWTSVSMESLDSAVAFNRRDYRNQTAAVSQTQHVFVFMMSQPARYTDVFTDFEDYMIADWDGEGATPIQKETLEASRRIIADLPLRLQKPEAAPGADGSICMEWVWELNGIKTKVFIDVGPSTKTLVYYRLMGGERHEQKFSELNLDALYYIHAMFQRVESAVNFD